MMQGQKDTELPWMPFFVGDWLGSSAIAMMLPEQEGAYWRLLLLAWGRGLVEPSLPSDSAELAVASRLGVRWRKLGPLIRAQFIDRADGRIFNEKQVIVWREQQAIHAIRSAVASRAGQASAEQRRLRRKGFKPASSTTPSGTPSTAPSTTPSTTPGPTHGPTSSTQKLEVRSSTALSLRTESSTTAPIGDFAHESAIASGATPTTNGNGNPPDVHALRAAERERRRALYRRFDAWCSSHPDEAVELEERVKLDLNLSVLERAAPPAGAKFAIREAMIELVAPHLLISSTDEAGQTTGGAG